MKIFDIKFPGGGESADVVRGLVHTAPTSALAPSVIKGVTFLGLI